MHRQRRPRRSAPRARRRRRRPRVVTAAIATSTRSTAASARQAAGSTRPIAAETITAPSTALGRYCTGSVRNEQERPRPRRPRASPAIWLRAPIASFTAVRDPLAPIEKPCVTRPRRWRRPWPAAPATARTFWSCLPANERAVRIPSAKQTRKMPTAAGSSVSTSAPGRDGTSKLGRPAGIVADRRRRRASLRSSAHEARIATRPRAAPPAAAGSSEAQREQHARARPRRRGRSRRWRHRARARSPRAAAAVARLDREPEQLRRAGRRRARPRRRGCSRSAPAARSSPRSSRAAAATRARSTPPTSSASSAADSAASRCPATASGSTAARDERRDRALGADDQLARGAEQRVGERGSSSA